VRLTTYIALGWGAVLCAILTAHSCTPNGPGVQVGSQSLPAVQVGPTSGPAVIVAAGAVSAPIQIGPTTRPMVLVVNQATVNVSAWAAVAGIVGGVALIVAVLLLTLDHRFKMRRLTL
jgi:membrane associated rhomboid family serine protease